MKIEKELQEQVVRIFEAKKLVACNVVAGTPLVVSVKGDPVIGTGGGEPLPNTLVMKKK